MKDSRITTKIGKIILASQPDINQLSFEHMDEPFTALAK